MASQAVSPSRTPSVLVIPPEGGQSITAFGSTAIFKLTGNDTGGALCLAVAETPPGAGPPPHVHARDDELFFVLQGELSFLAGREWVPAPQGSVIFAPRGVPHTFRNAGSSPSRHLVIALPSGFDEFYERCGEVFAQGEPVDRERLAAIAAEYGYRFLVPGS
jgi:quercetin dioxygenase-like cupin family protein